MKEVDMMKNETKQKIRIAAGVLNIIGAYSLGTIKAVLTPGTKGQMYRTEMKILNKGIKYKLTPFGDKEKLAKELNQLEKKDNELYQKYISEQAAKQKVKRR